MVAEPTHNQNEGTHPTILWREYHGDSRREWKNKTGVGTENMLLDENLVSEMPSKKRKSAKKREKTNSVKSCH